jgi:hypothetical protein
MYDNFNCGSVNELFLQLYEIVPLLIIFIKPIKNMKKKKFYGKGVFVSQREFFHLK